MKSRCKSIRCKSKGLTEGYCAKHIHQRPSVRYRTLLRHSKTRRLSVSIKKDQYIDLISGNICRYCEGPLNKTGASLDRLDNSKGYTVTNVVTCCSKCNDLRGSLLTESEMVRVIKLLKKLRGKQQPVWKQTRKGSGRYGFSKRK
jgi:hypothetical protein